MIQFMQHSNEVGIGAAETPFRALIEQAPDPIVVHVDSRIVYVNPALVELLRADSPDQLIGRPALDLCAPDCRDRVAARIQCHLRGEETSRRDEQRWLCLDGSTVDVESTAVPIIYDGRTAIYVLARDITGQVSAEKALSESESKFSVAFHNSPLPMTLASIVDGTLYEVNEAFQKLTGWSAREALGRTATELGLWPDQTQFDVYMNLVRDNKVIRDFPRDLCTRSGEMRDCMHTGTLLEIAGEPYLMNVVQDVTEIRRRELALGVAWGGTLAQ